MRTDLSDVTLEEFARRVAELRQQHREKHRNCHEPPSRGLGDTVAKLTKAVGIKPCGGCKERQKKLNEMFPYK